jgi:hypothetical protein
MLPVISIAIAAFCFRLVVFNCPPRIGGQLAPAADVLHHLVDYADAPLRLGEDQAEDIATNPPQVPLAERAAVAHDFDRAVFHLPLQRLAPPRGVSLRLL